MAHVIGWPPSFGELPHGSRAAGRSPRARAAVSRDDPPLRCSAARRRYLADVDEGGETFFPRALNAEGKEYKPWNGDHEDCYRGLAVPPRRGNAVLFYSMVPDGRLDERSLHGGCKPRGATAEKCTPRARRARAREEERRARVVRFGLGADEVCRLSHCAPSTPWAARAGGANQWIWNHPNRHSGVAPRRGAKRSVGRGGRAGCVDDDDNCRAWANSGECAKNPAYMESACKASCGKC